MLILLGAMLAWFAASYHGDAFIGRYGLRRVSIIADGANFEYWLSDTGLEIGKLIL